jgi:Tol biopolymer transport system component/DNA-binding winged helix-turn-helix (wHTH) protein
VESQTNTYEFGRFRLLPHESLLMLDERAVPLEPQVFETLRVLVENGGHLCEKGWLLEQVWGETFVEESNLTRNISVLRKVLGEGIEGNRYIETVPKRGYRFVAKVKKLIHDETLLIEEHTGSKFFVKEGISANETSHVQQPFTAPQTSLRTVPAQRLKSARNPYWLIAAAIMVSLITGGISLLYKFVEQSRGSQSVATALSPTMKIMRLTDNGRAYTAAISRDGKYLVYSVGGEGKQSLRLRQLAATTEQEIVGSQNVRFLGLTFSNDASLIYYNAAPYNNARGTIYQVPLLGGTPRKIVENAFGPPTLSPDGKQLAFIRTSEAAQHVDTLVVVNTDGTGERTVTTREGQAILNNGPSWSPDGKKLLCGASVEPDNLYESVLEISVESGIAKWLTPTKWVHVMRTSWLANGSGVIVVAREDPTADSQIWYLSPDGAVRRITNDLMSYTSYDISLATTADSRSMVVVQEDTSSHIWISSLNDANNAHQITSGKFDGIGGVSWTRDGKILCVLRNGNETDIWMISADGKTRHQLTTDGKPKVRPKMSRDGRYIAYSEGHETSRNVWRMDADGGNQKQLTTGNSDYAPDFTRDGEWLIFWSYLWSGKPQLGKVSVSGGESKQLTGYYSAWPVVSPDGKMLVAGQAKDEDNSAQLLILPINGGPPIKKFDLTATFPAWGLDWTGDGKSVAYVVTRDGVSNIWAQPIAGGPPRKLTNFTSDLIFRFALSSDGQQIVLARGTQTRDVVLITNFN